MTVLFIVEPRGPEEFLFVRSDGRRWKKSDQMRPVKDALKKAGLAPPTEVFTPCVTLTFPAKLKAECRST
jgi:hypothetical protein